MLKRQQCMDVLNAFDDKGIKRSKAASEKKEGYAADRESENEDKFVHDNVKGNSDTDYKSESGSDDLHDVDVNDLVDRAVDNMTEYEKVDCLRKFLVKCYDAVCEEVIPILKENPCTNAVLNSSGDDSTPFSSYL